MIANKSAAGNPYLIFSAASRLRQLRIFCRISSYYAGFLTNIKMIIPAIARDKTTTVVKRFFFPV